MPVIPVRVRVLCVLVALVAFGTSCAAREVNDKRPPAVKQGTKPAAYSLTVSGTVKANLKRDGVPLRTVALFDERLPSVTTFAIGPLEPVAMDGGTKLFGSFEILGYKGDGDYTIAPSAVDLKKPGTNTGAVSNALSHARVVYLDREGKTRVFDVVLAPCAIEIRDGGERGTMRCTRLADPDGATVSAVMTWQQ